MANAKIKQAQKQPVTARLPWIVAGLIVLALAATGFRVWLSHARATGEQGSAWVVTLAYRVGHARPGSRLSLAPPWDRPSARLYSQQLTLDGLRLQRTRPSSQGERRISLVAERRGEMAVNAEFSIHRFASRNPHRLPEKTVLSDDERAHFLSDEPGILDTGTPSVQAALDRIVTAGKNGRDLTQRIFDYVRDHTAYSAKVGASTASKALATGRADGLGRARAMAALCRAARLPARVVTGFRLAEQTDSQPVYWVEVYRDQRWLDFDPTQGFDGRLPDDYVAFSRDGPLLDTGGAAVLGHDFQVSEVDVPASLAGGGHRTLLSILDLSRLPLSARATLATLLLLPLGALLNTFVRAVVGVQTFGTFTPAMLALAAIYVDWLTAAVIFAVVAIIALFGRSTLPGLRLATGPRLTIVFALVAMAMALAVSLMAYFDLLTSTQVVLLPIVILTSLVDRIYSVADEQGLHTALIRLAWTGLTAIGCFFILSAEDLGEWLVSYPEMHLITIALILVLAAYRGPRLAQAPALRWLGPPTPTRDKADDGE